MGFGDDLYFCGDCGLCDPYLCPSDLYSCPCRDPCPCPGPCRDSGPSCPCCPCPSPCLVLDFCPSRDFDPFGLCCAPFCRPCCGCDQLYDLSLCLSSCRPSRHHSSPCHSSPSSTPLLAPWSCSELLRPPRSAPKASPPPLSPSRHPYPLCNPLAVGPEELEEPQTPPPQPPPLEVVVASRCWTLEPLLEPEVPLHQPWPSAPWPLLRPFPLPSPWLPGPWPWRRLPPGLQPEIWLAQPGLPGLPREPEPGPARAPPSVRAQPLALA
mmetsp:Transcript_44030/g.79706  ORF Transcript_44030/g.79706 Transcript_44030/m.79706 type:complete len:267 (-) Transcript_44030:374-1174(-)